MKTFQEYVEGVGNQIKTVGYIYQQMVQNGADPQKLKSQFKDLIYQVLTPQQQQLYARLPSDQRALFLLDKIDPNTGVHQAISLFRIGHKLTRQHKIDAEINKFQAENPQYGKQQAKGIYLDKIGNRYDR